MLLARCLSRSGNFASPPCSPLHRRPAAPQCRLTTPLHHRPSRSPPRRPAASLPSPLPNRRYHSTPPRCPPTSPPRRPAASPQRHSAALPPRRPQHRHTAAPMQRRLAALVHSCLAATRISVRRPSPGRLAAPQHRSFPTARPQHRPPPNCIAARGTPPRRIAASQYRCIHQCSLCPRCCPAPRPLARRTACPGLEVSLHPSSPHPPSPPLLPPEPRHDSPFLPSSP